MKMNRIRFVLSVTVLAWMLACLAPSGATAQETQCGVVTNSVQDPTVACNQCARIYPNWTRYNLTYCFKNYTADMSTADQQAQIDAAFQTWASSTSLFTFTRVADNSAADITLEYVGNLSFYAITYPQNSIIFNDSYTWGNYPNVTGNIAPNLDLQTIAAHEIGHVLGLGHSCENEEGCTADAERNAALMNYQPFRTGTRRSLRSYDYTCITCFYPSMNVTAKNQFRNPNPDGSINLVSGGTLSIDDVPFFTGQVGGFQTVRRVRGAQVKLSTADQLFPTVPTTGIAQYFRVFNTNGDAGWRADNNQPIGFTPTVTVTTPTNLPAVTYAANFRNRYDNLNITAVPEFDAPIPNILATPVSAVEQSTVSLTAPDMLSQQPNGRTYFFESWADGNTSLTRNFTVSSPAPQSARYKAKLYSSYSSATASSVSTTGVSSAGSAQRRLVKRRARPGQSTDTYYFVYESNQKLYLCRSTDRGLTWGRDTFIGTGTNPSLASDADGVLIVFAGLGDGYIYSRYFADTGVLQAVQTVPNLSPIPNAHPVAVRLSTNGSEAMLAVEVGYEESYGTGSAIALARYGGDGNGGYQWSYMGEVPQSQVAGTVDNPFPSLNPAFDFVDTGTPTPEAKLVWQTYVSDANVTAPLKFIKVIASGETSVTFAPSAPLSIATDARTNRYRYPTLVTDDANQNSYVAWLGYSFTGSSPSTVVLYRALLTSGTPPVLLSTPVSEYGYSSNWFNPAIFWSRNNEAVVMMNTGSLHIIQARPASGGIAYLTPSSEYTGQSPAVSPRGDTLVAFTRYTVSPAPFAIGFVYGKPPQSPPNDNRLAGTGEGKELFATQDVSSSDEPQTHTATRITVSETTSAEPAFLTLTLSPEPEDSLSLSPVTQLDAARLADTVALNPETALNDLKTLNTTPEAGFGTISAKMKVRTRKLSRLAKQAKVWFDLCDATSGTVRASSPKVSLTEADTAREVSATFDAAAVGVLGQAVVVKARVQGMMPKPGQTISAGTQLRITESSAARGISVNYTAGDMLNTNRVGLPTAFDLVQNYPNPFNPATTIDYALPKTARVSLKIYDVMGRVVADVVDDTKPAGYHTATFDASRLTSGTYFYRLQATDFVRTKKMTLIK